VRFEPLNLLDPFPRYASGVDIIFCQNVTIYFQIKTCQELMARFYGCLPPGGLLCLGFSETLWNIFDRFHSREVAGAYVYYKETLESSPPSAVSSTRLRATTPALEHRPISRGSARPAARRTGGSHTRETEQNQTGADGGRGLSDQAALDRGRDLLGQGNTDEALRVLRGVSPQSACAPQALTLTARAHADRGDLDLAAAEVRRVIEIDALNEEAQLLLGVIFGRQGQWPLAIQQLERARYLSADSALVSFYLAEAYRQDGRIDKAAREYRNTLRKLDVHPPGMLLDGVAVGWLRETCQRQMEYLPRSR
jgi:chemotaxis protein methyltransferase CheR